MKRLTIALILSMIVVTGTYNEVNADPFHRGINYEQLTKHQRAQVDCLAMNVYREAGYESVSGQLAVAVVTMNRVQSGKFKNTVCRVVHQSRDGLCQFSWTCVKSGQAKVNPTVYNYIKELSTKVFINRPLIHDYMSGALFFHTKDIKPNWKNVKVVTRVGQHVFYKPIGAT